MFKMFQVQLKQGKNIKNVDLEAKNVDSILSFFEYASTMKVTLIKEIVYSLPPDSVIPVDDFQYNTLFSTFAKNTAGVSREFIFNNIKLIRNEREIFQKMRESFEIEGLNIDTIYASMFKR